MSTTATSVAAILAGSAARRGLVRLTAPVLPIAACSWLSAAMDTGPGVLGMLAPPLMTVLVLAAAAVLGWRSQDAAAARLGGGPARVWAFRRAVRTGVPPGLGTGDEVLWRAEAHRQIHSTEAEVAGAPWLWVVGLVIGAPVVVAWAVGWESWHLPAYLPAALLLGWPLVRWDAVRRRDRLRRLSQRLR